MSKAATVHFPPAFQFSQLCMRDFSDCAYRFKLKYLDRLAWPALVSEPASEQENRARMGAFFHHLIHQHRLGLAEGPIADSIDGAFAEENARELHGWWQNYLDFCSATDLGTTFPELSLSARVGGYRVVARLDLLSLREDPDSGQLHALIIDWKTSPRPEKRATLNVSWQTRVYRYLLVRCGEQLNGGRPLQPEQVEMLYWFAAQPEQSVRLAYHSDLFQDDEQALADQILDITRRGAEDFPLTTEEKRCRFCVYRSLCRRGVQAGDYGDQDLDEETPLLDFDQVEEIAF